jgi:hypothetical protein
MFKEVVERVLKFLDFSEHMENIFNKPDKLKPVWIKSDNLRILGHFFLKRKTSGNFNVYKPRSFCTLDFPHSFEFRTKFAVAHLPTPVSEAPPISTRNTWTHFYNYLIPPKRTQSVVDCPAPKQISSLCCARLYVCRTRVGREKFGVKSANFCARGFLNAFEWPWVNSNVVNF